MRCRILTWVGTFLLLVRTSTAGAGPMVGDYLSYFNIPKVDAAGNVIPSHTIKNKLLAYVNGAVAGSEIRGHITTISHSEITNALKAAYQRGVAVYLVHDGSGMRVPSSEYPEGYALEQFFGTRHRWCGWGLYYSEYTSCVSSIYGATHHIKNWYFSNTIVDGKRRRYSTWVTSYNLTKTSDKQFNDAFVVNDNYELYAAYVKSFVRFYQQARSSDFYNVAGRGHHVIPSANTEISYAPQTTSPGHADYHPTNDQVAMALSRIDAYEPGCTLAVANLTISETRWAILDELVRIRALGCKVQVAYSQIALGALFQLWVTGIELRLAQKPQIHSKMMLYKGRYDGEPGRTFVWGGSHNWTMNSLRKRDEVFVAISRLGIYLRYREYFDHIWAVSGR